MSAFLLLIKRDLVLAFAQRGAVGTALGFYLIVITLLPFGIGPELRLLARIAPGMLWVALLLSALLTLDRIFHADHEDGSLEVLRLGAIPLELVALAKALAHWLTSCLPLVAFTPVLGLLLNLDTHAFGILLLTMLLGTPALSLLGAVGAALTLGVRRGGLIASLIVLPFYIPTLIFGVASVSAYLASDGKSGPPLIILGGITLVMLVVGPLFSAMAIKAQG
ncbi:MAG: heme exporter protein CcmB [Hyphomicrobiaceae bacterium]|nr:MAG: heme exporter protein CcmB [Hyphomicrobiaceae bacterium]